MVVITEADLQWHESLQILLVLSRGPADKGTVYEEVRKRQRKMVPDYTRSKSTFRYWVRRHVEDGKIRERGSSLELTPLGQWIVSSTVGTLSDRELFLFNYACLECSTSCTRVLYELDTGTAETNKRGDISMDVRCPRCGRSIERHKATRRMFPSVQDFLQFHRSAVKELRCLGLLA